MMMVTMMTMMMMLLLLMMMMMMMMLLLMMMMMMMMMTMNPLNTISGELSAFSPLPLVKNFEKNAKKEARSCQF